MVRYFYAWTPLVIVAAVVLLSLPWLGLIALTIAALATLAALLAALAALAAVAWAIVAASLAGARAIGRRWHRESAPQPTLALSLAKRRRT